MMPITTSELINRCMIEVTERAKEYLAKVGDPNVSLTVKGGGCSGFQYGFQFEEEKAADDFEFESAGVAVLVDPLSYQYLTGASIDFIDDLQGSRFVVNNPNATTTCGCGSSFGI